MNQSHWTYWDDYGRQHVVGILHGANTGHLVVHCNSKVMLIDFSVDEAKTYSFFIDEHLCKLKVLPNGEDFKYQFDVDENKNTKKYQQQKKEDKKYMYQKIGSIIATIALFIVVTLILQSFNW